MNLWACVRTCHLLCPDGSSSRFHVPYVSGRGADELDCRFRLGYVSGRGPLRVRTSVDGLQTTDFKACACPDGSLNTFSAHFSSSPHEILSSLFFFFLISNKFFIKKRKAPLSIQRVYKETTQPTHKTKPKHPTTPKTHMKPKYSRSPH